MSHFSAACIFRTVWKDSRVSPIPKVTPVTAVTAGGDLRLIALTTCIAEIQKCFAKKWLIEVVRHKVDPKEFGCLKALKLPIAF